MPLLRCPKCGQAYDVPGVISVRLGNAIATCHCGEWLAGSKAAVLARMLNPEQIKEIDLQPYRIDTPPPPEPGAAPPATETGGVRTRSVRVIARGARESVNRVFTIGEHPLWIGRKGCHVELAEAELSIRHCSIMLRGGDLVIRDAGSHTGIFLDGQKIDEAVITGGSHLLRAGSALINIETVDESGERVEPIALGADEGFDERQIAEAMLAGQSEGPLEGGRRMLVCLEGPLAGQEFEIPPTGLVVGREGHVRVPDEFLSRKHFEVMPDADGSVRVRDLGSRNGTFLNALPATNTKVQRGDEIRAGVNRFRIEQRV